MNESFSNSRKQRIVALYSTEYKELVRAYLYDGQERISQLISQFTTAESKELRINKGDLDLMISMAQDYLATHTLMNPEPQNTIKTKSPQTLSGVAGRG